MQVIVSKYEEAKIALLKQKPGQVYCLGYLQTIAREKKIL
jgi:hypothetical protein